MLQQQYEKLNAILAHKNISVETCDIAEEALLRMAGINKKSPAMTALLANEDYLYIVYQGLDKNDVATLVNFLQTKYKDNNAEFKQIHSVYNVYINSTIYSNEIFPDIIKFIEQEATRDEYYLDQYNEPREPMIEEYVQDIYKSLENLKTKLTSTTTSGGFHGKLFQRIDKLNFGLATKCINDLYLLLNTQSTLTDLPRIFYAFENAKEMFITDKFLLNLPEFKEFENAFQKLEMAYEKFNPNFRSDVLNSMFNPFKKQ